MSVVSVKPVIFVGVDGSWRDTGALEWALQESLLRQEPLQALHVIDERVRHAPGWEPADVDDASMELVNDVQKYLDEHAGGLDSEADLRVGPPARSLVAAGAGSRMIVVGRRGLGTFKRLLIGSTSEAVVTQAAAAEVPVVVVPSRWQRSDHTGPVVAAVDDKGDNIAVIEFAIAEAVLRGVPVRLLHVWELPSMYSWDAMNVAGLSDQWFESVRREIDALADEWRNKYPDLTIEVDVRPGHEVDGVVTGAEESDAQLLVVGSKQRARMVTMLLGSVTRGALHHATCPLAVVPVRVSDGAQRVGAQGDGAQRDGGERGRER